MSPQAKFKPLPPLPAVWFDNDGITLHSLGQFMPGEIWEAR